MAQSTDQQAAGWASLSRALLENREVRGARENLFMRIVPTS